MRAVWRLRAALAPLFLTLCLSLALPAQPARASTLCAEIFAGEQGKASANLVPSLELLAGIVEEGQPEFSRFSQSLLDSTRRSRARIARIWERVLNQGNFTEREMDALTEQIVATLFPENRLPVVNGFRRLFRLLTPRRYKADIVLDLAFHSELRQRLSQALDDIGIEQRKTWLGEFMSLLRDHPESVNADTTIVLSHFLEMVPLFTTLTGITSERVMRALADKDPTLFGPSLRRTGWKIEYAVSTLSRAITAMGYAVVLYLGSIETYESAMLGMGSRRVMNVTTEQLQDLTARRTDQQLQTQNLQAWIGGRERILHRKFDPNRYPEDQRFLKDRQEDLQDVSILRQFDIDTD